MAYIFERMKLFEGFEDRNETNSSKICELDRKLQQVYIES